MTKPTSSSAFVGPASHSSLAGHSSLGGSEFIPSMPVMRRMRDDDKDLFDAENSTYVGDASIVELVQKLDPECMNLFLDIFLSPPSSSAAAEPSRSSYYGPQ